MATRTQTRNPHDAVPQQAQPIARLAPSRLPIVPAVAKEFEVDPNQWRVLVDQIFPNAKTVEAIGMALAYCRARKLDIFKRPVHIVPMWSTAIGKMVETVWPGISEIRTTAHRTGQYAGIDPVQFGDDVDVDFEGFIGRNADERIAKSVRFPEWASVTVYRWVHGQKAAFNALVYWEEIYATIGKTVVPNDMWAKRPRGQLMKCVEAAALRMAFPEELGNIYVAEEMEGRTIDGDVNAATAIPTDAPKGGMPPAPPPPPPKPEPTAPSDEGGKIIEGTANKPDPQEEDRPIQNEASDVEGSTPSEDESPADFLTRLDGELMIAADKATLLEIWEREQAAWKLDGTPFLENAEQIYARHEARVEKRQLEAEGQQTMFGDDDTFPGDR